jgi:hypothetical protein
MLGYKDVIKPSALKLKDGRVKLTLEFDADFLNKDWTTIKSNYQKAAEELENMLRIALGGHNTG